MKSHTAGSTAASKPHMMDADSEDEQIMLEQPAILTVTLCLQLELGCLDWDLARNTVFCGSFHR